MRGRHNMHYTLANDYCERYGVPDLSLDEKKHIMSFWGKYGIKLADYSYHRMFYNITGIHDPRFVPDYIAGHVVYPYYNDHAYEYTWRDKNMFDRLLPEVPFPKTIAKCIRNRFLINNIFCSRNCTNMVIELIADAILSSNNNTIIIKPARHSGFGRGVKKYDIHDRGDVEVAVAEWESVSDFIIQEYIVQHSVLSSFNQSSTNMIRICSWRHGNTVDVLYAAARIGVPGALTDISFVNGEERVNIIGISKTGEFNNKILNQDGIKTADCAEEQRVPAWDRIISIIKANHLKIDNFDIVGWDFTVNEDLEPICFEWNVQWPGTVLYQYANGPLFGEHTEELLDFLNKSTNRENYIPCYLRFD